ncbi:hypothetical protein NUM3379_18710 [Kineococcus sp. NUM-3379]
MARYAVLIYASDSAHTLEAAAADTESCDQHADELAAAGSMVMACALTPRDMATSLRAGSTTSGTFLDSQQIVAGFYVIEAPDLDAALAIAGTNPVLREGGGVEVRPVHSGGVVERTSEQHPAQPRRRPAASRAPRTPVPPRGRGRGGPPEALPAA